MPFKRWMTAIIGAGLLLALGVLAALWMAVPKPEPRADQELALVAVSPLGQSGGEWPGQGAPAPPGQPGPELEPGQMAEQPSNPPPRSPKRAPREGQQAGRLAIVIDDLGYNLAVPERLLALGLPLTFSIIPLERYSSEVAERVRRAGREFLVHLPMEPERYPEDNPGPNALLLGMGDQDLRARLAEQLDSLPGARGANNHMGSAFTADARRMAIVQETLARRGLLFLNSRTSASAVPGEIAGARGFDYRERDVFLDNSRNEAAIRAQLEQAIARAREQGQAIAIGHPYPETLRVLRERLPRLAAEGVLLVPLSEL